MIKLGDKILRNLEEQVQYLTNYHDVNQGLVQWGIRVVGQVDTVDELPAPSTYKGEYGDAFAVGIAAPFYFYIWTRASIQGGSDYWFPFGRISIVGPQGPKGDKGDKGEAGESSKWYYSDSPSNPHEGDMKLMPNGDVYRYQMNDQSQYDWVKTTNIKGPQGAQGPVGPKGEQGIPGMKGEKGDTGDVGGFINIWGILGSTEQLPTPASLNNLTIAYLVGASSPYDLYVQVGSTSSEAMWTNTGPFNAATAVSVNGNFQNIWDADTKVSKYTGSTGLFRVYGVDTKNNETTIIIGTSDTSYSSGTLPYVRPKESGTIQPNGYLITHNPVNPYQAATKDYVDTQIAGLGGGGGKSIYRHRITVTRGYNGDTVLEKYGYVNFLVYLSNNTPITTYDQLSSLNTQLGGSITANLCWGYSELYITDSAEGLALPYRVYLGSTTISLDYIAAYPAISEPGSVSWSDFNNITITDNVTEV